MPKKKKPEVKDLITIVQYNQRPIDTAFSWVSTVHRELDSDSNLLAYHIILGKVLRIDYPELQEWNPEDNSWHECLIPYNHITQSEYKFCKLKENE